MPDDFIKKLEELLQFISKLIKSIGDAVEGAFRDSSFISENQKEAMDTLSTIRRNPHLQNRLQYATTNWNGWLEKIQNSQKLKDGFISTSIRLNAEQTISYTVLQHFFERATIPIIE